MEQSHQAIQPLPLPCAGVLPSFFTLLVFPVSPAVLSPSLSPPYLPFLRCMGGVWLDCGSACVSNWNAWACPGGIGIFE